SDRGQKLRGDQITLPTRFWDEDAPTGVKTEGGNGNVTTQQKALELDSDYFKDMTSTKRKTQEIIKKTELLDFGIPGGSTGFSDRLVATHHMPFNHQSPELGRNGTGSTVV
ncbi:hypothetical protein FD754_016319, partial [Muntiacus muntjak]